MWTPGEADQAELDRFRSLMDDDLDTPAVVAQLFGLATAANTALDGGDPASAATAWATIGEITRAVGIEIKAAGGEVPDRDHGLGRPSGTRPGPPRTSPGPTPCGTSSSPLGWEVEDTPEGTRVHLA